MKKRLLALILCLVLATSLLPLSAAAYTEEEIASFVKGITHNGTYCGDTYFTLEFPKGKSTITDESGITPTRDSNGRYILPGGSGGKTYTIQYEEENGTVQDKTITVTILNHDWQLTKTENSLAATCRNREQYKCSVGEVSLTLDAHSVTLPTSPFNARLEGKEQFKKEVPNAVIGDLVYKYKGPNGWSVVEPTAANAKAGEYQVGVQIIIPSNNPGDNVSGQSQGGEVYDLYVKYTAADPAVTAQTGDNRPIELMLAGALAFSVLAAAAFVLDNKRRAQP